MLATPLFNDGLTATPPGVRAASIGANISTLLLAAAFLWRARTMLFHAPQYILLFSLLLFATIYSVRGGRSAIVRA